jgi:hypothetical protein
VNIAVGRQLKTSEDGGTHRCSRRIAGMCEGVCAWATVVMGGGVSVCSRGSR